MKFNVGKERIDVNYRGFYNIYNILAVYSALNVMKIGTKKFNDLLSDYKPQIGRMELIDLGKPVILNLAKNPAGFNQAIQTVILDKRKKDVIVAINDPGQRRARRFVALGRRFRQARRREPKHAHDDRDTALRHSAEV